MTASSRSKFQISTTRKYWIFSAKPYLLLCTRMGTIKSLLCHCSLICFCCQSFLSLLKLMFPPLQDSSSSMKDLSETSILLNMELDIVPWQFPITHFTSSFTPPPQRFHSCLGIGGPDSMMRWVSEANRSNPVRENATLTFGKDGNLVLDMQQNSWSRASD
jgi:hypothetical protein